ncbi:MAG TPA: hypothetical protein VNP97_00145 [Microbacterium sp.]|nr:hypothetical protein [Microbacterium sp.]
MRTVAAEVGVLLSPVGAQSRMVSPQHIGILEHPEFVIVHRDQYSYSGVLFEWRLKRQPDGFFERSARVIYMDEMEQVLRQSWFLEAFVDPSPNVQPHQV